MSDGSPIFRSESNTDDERAASFRGNGFVVSFGTNAPYPASELQIRTDDGREFKETLWTSHLGFGQFVSRYEFKTVLEIGSRGGIIARALDFIGKQVLTVEILPHYEAKYSGDYLDISFDEEIDAIWCAHVFEHQRHPGKFLEKCFDDLRDGGVLAITVPSALHPLLIGHHNIFTGLLLIYQLILAGFDCSEASFRQYDQQMTVIVRKKPNGIPRLSFAATMMGNKGDLGQVDNLVSFFPKEVQGSINSDGAAWGEIRRIAWD